MRAADERPPFLFSPHTHTHYFAERCAKLYERRVLCALRVLWQRSSSSRVDTIAKFGSRNSLDSSVWESIVFRSLFRSSSKLNFPLSLSLSVRQEIKWNRKKSETISQNVVIQRSWSMIFNVKPFQRLCLAFAFCGLACSGIACVFHRTAHPSVISILLKAITTSSPVNLVICWWSQFNQNSISKLINLV